MIGSVEVFSWLLIAISKLQNFLIFHKSVWKVHLAFECLPAHSYASIKTDCSLCLLYGDFLLDISLVCLVIDWQELKFPLSSKFALHVPRCGNLNDSRRPWNTPTVPHKWLYKNLQKLLPLKPRYFDDWALNRHFPTKGGITAGIRKSYLEHNPGTSSSAWHKHHSFHWDVKTSGDLTNFSRKCVPTNSLFLNKCVVVLKTYSISPTTTSPIGFCWDFKLNMAIVWLQVQVTSYKTYFHCFLITGSVWWNFNGCIPLKIPCSILVGIIQVVVLLITRLRKSGINSLPLKNLYILSQYYRYLSTAYSHYYAWYQKKIAGTFPSWKNVID